jgi:hypothetical protein
MKITRKAQKKGTLWSVVQVGATFEFENMIGIKISEAFEPLAVRPPASLDDCETINAIYLDGGCSTFFEDDECVNLLNAELVITE